jgi:hypothetical protein
MTKTSISNYDAMIQKSGNGEALLAGKRRPNRTMFLGEFWVDSDGEIWEEPTLEEILKVNLKLLNPKR